MRDFIYYCLWFAAGWSLLKVWTIGDNATDLQRMHADLEMNILVVGAFIYEKCLIILNKLDRLRGEQDVKA